MKIDLADGESSPLENLLVERVISTWLELYYHETRSAQGEEKSLRWAEFRLKQLSAASDRHMKAIGALATLKKLSPSCSTASAAHQAPAVSEPCVQTNGNTPAGEPLDKPERTNGHVNGHAANRVAALLNRKAVSAEG